MYPNNFAILFCFGRDTISLFDNRIFIVIYLSEKVDDDVPNLKLFGYIGAMGSLL